MGLRVVVGVFEGGDERACSPRTTTPAGASEPSLQGLRTQDSYHGPGAVDVYN